MEKIKEEFISESREQLPCVSKIITSNELLDLIYKGESLPQDNRFLPIEEGGVFKYFNIDDLTRTHNEKKFYPLIEVNKQVIALSELEENPYQQKSFWIKFVSVDPRYQNLGYASKLAEEIVRFAKKKDFSLESSSRSEEGYLKLKSLFDRLTKQYSVHYIDKDKKL